MALHLAPVNLVIIITYMYPTMVTVLSAVILKKPVTGFKIAALLLTIVGILLAIGMDSGGYSLGIIFAVITAISHSLYLIFGSLSIQKAGPFSASTVIILTSLVILGFFVGIQGPQWPMNVSGWLAIIASALISTVLGRVAFYEGLRPTDIANASIISTFEVAVTVALAIIILGETVTLPKILGACLVISAVIMLAKNEYETAQTTISQSVR
jgi:drug/metabolite transporter (DMT)-like permease